jgi:hypothetical protein
MEKNKISFGVNGWKHKSFDPKRAQSIWRNPGWPGEWIRTGGGFELSPKLMAMAKPGELGSGGDYGLLRAFLDRVGPNAP